MWSSQLLSFRAEIKSTWRLASPTPPKLLLGSPVRTYLSVSKSISTAFLESTSATQVRLERYPASEYQTTALVSSGASSLRRIWMVGITTWPRQPTVFSLHSNRLLVKIHSKFQSSLTHSESWNLLMERTSLRSTTKTRFSTNLDQLKLTNRFRWAST